MSNSAFIAAMGSVAAAIFFVAAVACRMVADRSTTDRVMFVFALILTAVYLFVSLFWGVRATLLESFQLSEREEEK